MKTEIKNICNWFNIHYQLIKEKKKIKGIEFVLPKWLSKNEDFMDKYDLDYGIMFLDLEEFEEILKHAGIILAKKYFGDTFDGSFDLSNLSERSYTAFQIGNKIKGYPEWYECKTEPKLYEEFLITMKQYNTNEEIDEEIETEKGLNNVEKEKDNKTVNTALSLLDSKLLNFN